MGRIIDIFPRIFGGGRAQVCFPEQGETAEKSKSRRPFKRARFSFLPNFAVGTSDYTSVGEKEEDEDSAWQAGKFLNKIPLPLLTNERSRWMWREMRFPHVPTSYPRRFPRRGGTRGEYFFFFFSGKDGLAPVKKGGRRDKDRAREKSGTIFFLVGGSTPGKTGNHRWAVNEKKVGGNCVWEEGSRRPISASYY